MYLLLLLIALTTIAASPPDTPDIIKTKRSIDINNAQYYATQRKLPKSIKVSGYNLRLEPFMKEGVFKGQVRVNLTWLVTSNQIVMHLAPEVEITDLELNIAEFIDVTNSKDKKIYKALIKHAGLDPKSPIYTVTLEKPVEQEGVGIMDITFTGHMQNSPEAFFKTVYINENGTESIIAATNLRSNNARRLFPCFDEGAHKSPFKLSVLRPAGMSVISNTPLESTEILPNREVEWDHFEVTPPLAPFSIGFIISDLQQFDQSQRFRDGYGNNLGTNIRVWSRPDFFSALDGVTLKFYQIFRELSDFWGIELPLKKLDIVALPNYNGVRPIDSWGLIMFKESDITSEGYLLFAQELCYQWFGMYSAPQWWSEAHMNKAFVGYIAMEVVSRLDGGRELEGKWPMTVLYSMYYEYGKKYPHSKITGLKQESLSTKIELSLRMLSYTLGKDTIRDGLREFISDTKFSIFFTLEPWDSINQVAQENHKLPVNLTIKDIVETWLYKDRVPVITVKRFYENNTMFLNQSLFDRDRRGLANDGIFWVFPVVLIRGDRPRFTNTTPVTWIPKEGNTTVNDLPSKDHYIIINPEEIAPGLINYDTHTWNLLQKALETNKTRLAIPELTRAKLLHDAWNLAYAGELDFAIALNMTLFLKNEKNHIVWDPFFTFIDHVGKKIGSGFEWKFRLYVKSMLEPLYKELSSSNPENYRPVLKKLKENVKNFLCKVGYEYCVLEAKEEFSKWMRAERPDDGNPISNQFLCPVFKWGSNEEWEFGLQRVLYFPASRKLSERTYLLKTLAGCPVQEQKIHRLINMSIMAESTNFSDTDLFTIVNMLASNPQGSVSLFNVVNDNWEMLKKKFENSSNFWDNLLNQATANFLTEKDYEMVSKFYHDHQHEFSTREHLVSTNLINLKEAACWSKHYLPVIEKWLDWYLAQNTVKNTSSAL